MNKSRDPIAVDFDFTGSQLDELTDAEPLQIVARGQGMTEIKLLQIAPRRADLTALPNPKSFRYCVISGL
jgi:hypothetical protein